MPWVVTAFLCRFLFSCFLFVGTFFAESSVTDRWSAAKSKASQWSAWVEVMFGMILVAELFLPRRYVVLMPRACCVNA